MELQRVEVAGVHRWDYPKFGDAYISYAEDKDGRKLTDKELENLSYDIIQQHVSDYLASWDSYEADRLKDGSCGH